jgi:hypothetical protein
LFVSFFFVSWLECLGRPLSDILSEVTKVVRPSLLRFSQFPHDDRTAKEIPHRNWSNVNFVLKRFWRQI